jgi:hypothetical protein
MDENGEERAAAGPGAAEEEVAAARRLIHELPAGEVERQILFRLYVAGEDEERIRTGLGLDAAHYDRILSRTRQRFKEILRAPDPSDTADLSTEMRRGLTGLAAREAAGLAVVREGLLAWLRSPAATVAMLVLLLAALASTGFLELRAHRLRKALDGARLTSPPRPVDPAQVLEVELRQAREQRDQEKLSAAERIEKERRQRAELTAQLERERRPQVNTPLLPLEPERSRPGAPRQAVHPITLPRNPGWIVLSLELEGAAAAPVYQATLAAPGGASLWSGGGLTPNPWRSLVISLPSTLLKPGDYQVRIDAVPLQGPPVPAGRYSFRVLRGAAP